MNGSQSTPIEVAYPDAADLHLRLGIGACRLRIMPGAGDTWVSGAYHDPTGALPCRVTREGGLVRISQGTNVGELLGLVSGAPRFALELGLARPYALTIEAGAAEVELNLGGLPLTRLTARLGATANEIAFTAPNPRPMALFSLSAGAGSVEITRLADANCADLVVEGGAASYTLDFGGHLRRDLHARVTAGIAAVELVVPLSTAAKITTESVLGALTIGDGLTKHLGAFWTPAALRGATPVVTIQASVTLGSLALKTTGGG